MTIVEEVLSRKMGKAAPAAGDGGDRPELDFEPERWPEPPAAEAYEGLAGDAVRLIDPETEADPAAVLAQFLVAFGNAAGRGSWQAVGPRRHHPNLYCCLVGRTAKGRKGTAWSWVQALFPDPVAPGWAEHRVMSGLSSGEGVIAAVQDERRRKSPVKERGRVTGYEDVIQDEGCSDKRLLTVEEEFAGALRSAAREGNILSAVLRQGWDTGSLRTMTRNNPLRATEAHVSVVGHIGKPELLKCLSDTDAANGLANRFLWVCARRSKLLPEGGGLLNLAPLHDRIAEALRHAGQAGRLRRSPYAARLWREVYPALSADHPGTLGTATNRAEAQVLRLGLIYALLDLAGEVQEHHLRAALALWDYCRRSARWVFGDSDRDHDADALLEHLARRPEGMTLTEINGFFGRHKSARDLARMLQGLVDSGEIVPGRRAAGGRPAEPWRLAAVLANLANPANPAKAVGG